MQITTKKANNASGAPVIIAKGGGAQKTTRYDLSKSSDWNHGAAAAALLNHLDSKDDGIRALAAASVLASGQARHEVSDGGGVHKFNL